MCVHVNHEKWASVGVESEWVSEGGGVDGELVWKKLLQFSKVCWAEKRKLKEVSWGYLLIFLAAAAEENYYHSPWK